MRSLADDLFGNLRSIGVTAMITIGAAFGMTQIIEYGADSCTILKRERIGNNMFRSIYIMKMRGSKISSSIKVLDISDDGMGSRSSCPIRKSAGALIIMTKCWAILAGDEGGPVCNKMGGIWNVIDAEAKVLAKIAANKEIECELKIPRRSPYPRRYQRSDRRREAPCSRRSRASRRKRPRPSPGAF